MLHLSLLIKFDSDMTLIKIFHVRVKSVPETVNSGSGCDNYWHLNLATYCGDYIDVNNSCIPLVTQIRR